VLYTVNAPDNQIVATIQSVLGLKIEISNKFINIYTELNLPKTPKPFKPKNKESNQEKTPNDY
jgi:hypothetical protein